MKADILGIPIETLETDDAGTVGCAMMAGLACGAFGSIAEAAAKMVRRVGRFDPDPARHALYSEVFSRYERLYAAVRPLM